VSGRQIRTPPSRKTVVVGLMVFSQRPQPIGDTIITAFDERPGHLFECRVHFVDMGSGPPSIDRYEANFR
jgi:hypothetical protein